MQKTNRDIDQETSIRFVLESVSDETFRRYIKKEKDGNIVAKNACIFAIQGKDFKLFCKVLSGVGKHSYSWCNKIDGVCSDCEKKRKEFIFSKKIYGKSIKDLILNHNYRVRLVFQDLLKKYGVLK
ncbi:hypothetical protein KAH94_01140 [bacterium]|nr:hypothetical protein [bacterium]